LLPITFADTVRVMNLPLHHRDAFDLILIAQAINNSLTLVSCDAAFTYSSHRSSRSRVDRAIKAGIMYDPWFIG